MEDTFEIQETKREINSVMGNFTQLSDVPGFAVLQLGRFCINLLSRLKTCPGDSRAAALYEKAEFLLGHYITDCVSDYPVTEYKVRNVTMKDIRTDSTRTDTENLDRLFFAKETALSYLTDALRKKDMDMLYSIYSILDLSSQYFSICRKRVVQGM